jgi:hypothetical protein
MIVGKEREPRCWSTHGLLGGVEVVLSKGQESRSMLEDESTGVDRKVEGRKLSCAGVVMRR